ncbi:hypothetical protein SAMN05428977_102344 [Nitrosomonas sp. Nm166]|nr:hypothetical protein SAMN05428977_102344 [Nitrosomonas sp. Nm166]
MLVNAPILFQIFIKIKMYLFFEFKGDKDELY